MSNSWLILLCGGIGSRMEYPEPKQFIKINNKEIILHTLDKFLNIDSLRGVVCVCHKDYINKLSDIIGDKKYKKLNIRIIEGSDTCNGSIKNGILYLQSKAKCEDIVIIHDSVRPFIDRILIERVISGALKNNSCCPRIGCYETLFFSDGSSYVSKRIDRDLISRIQTPQAYKYSNILKCYEDLEKIDISSFVYASELYTFLGNNLFTCDGYKYNFKITDKEDLKIARILMCDNTQYTDR